MTTSWLAWRILRELQSLPALCESESRSSQPISQKELAHPTIIKYFVSWLKVHCLWLHENDSEVCGVGFVEFEGLGAPIFWGFWGRVSLDSFPKPGSVCWSRRPKSDPSFASRLKPAAQKLVQPVPERWGQASGSFSVQLHPKPPEAILLQSCKRQPDVCR